MPHTKREGHISTRTRTSRPLSNAEIAFEPQTRTSACPAFQLRHGPQPVQRPTANADLASNCKRGSQSKSSSNLKRGLHQQHDARITFCAKRDSRVALQYADLRVAIQYQNAPA